MFWFLFVYVEGQGSDYMFEVKFKFSDPSDEMSFPLISDRFLEDYYSGVALGFDKPSSEWRI